MATDIGTLAVKLVAKTNTFKSDMQGAAGMVQRFTSGLRGMAGSVAGIGAMLGAGFSVAGITSAISKSMASIDELSELSERLGSSTSEIIALHRAAVLVGAGTEHMDTALEKLNRSLGEAAMGTGNAKDAIKALGLDTQKLIAMGPAQAFVKIGDAMNRVSNQSTKAAIAAAFFGRNGMQLMNVLALGTAGANEFSIAARKSGVDIGDVASMQVSNAVDAFASLKEVLSGIVSQLSAQLSPFIEHISNQLVDMGTRGEGMGVKVQRAFTHVADILFNLKNAFNGIKVAALGFVAAISTLPHVIIGPLNFMVHGIFEATRGLIDAANMIPGVNIKVKDVTNTEAYFEDFATSTENAMVAAHKAFLDALKTSIDTALDPKPMHDAIEEIQNQSKQNAMKALEKQKALGPKIEIGDTAELDKAMKAIETKAAALKASVATPMEKFSEQKAEADKLLAAQKIDMETYRRLGVKARQDLEAAMPKREQEQEQLQDPARRPDVGEFKQVDLSRMALNGPGAGMGNIGLRQIDLAQRQLEIMRQIALNTRGPQYGLLA